MTEPSAVTGRPHGVVVMAYGSPRRPEDLAAYYTDIRRGRPPSAEQLAELARRYEAIGGLSPLVERSEAQRAMLAHELRLAAPGETFIVAAGFRHSQPSIEDAVAAVVDAGVDRIVGMVLAPHYSSMSVAVYLERAGDAATARGVPFAAVESWATEPSYIDYLAGEVRAGLRHPQLPAATHVVFTAHSLPRRILELGDRYPAEVAATADLVARRAGLPADRWSIAWQSAGRTDEPWLEPDLLSVIDSLAVAGGVDGLLVCPCGFVSDHLEVLYDLDIEARQRAEQRGLSFRRTPVVNDDSGVMMALARRILEASRTSCSES